MKKQTIIAITGPSASGKTRLSVELAKSLNGEIISVDSRQIYKELDIGTAKVAPGEMQGIKHRLIDVIDLNNTDYTAANYCDEANKALREIFDEGKTPILAGGTGLYFRILLQDFDLPRVAPDKELREKLEQKSSKELHEMLTVLDFDLAQKIHCNNKVKIIRALEVCITLGIPMSKAQKTKRSANNVLWYGLNFKNRETLYERINKRVDLMFEQGLEREAENLFKKYQDNKILLGTIGYEEFAPYFKGETDIESVKNLIKQNTRRYAKRQISWFKANPDIKSFYCDEMPFEEIFETIVEDYKKALE